MTPDTITFSQIRRWLESPNSDNWDITETTCVSIDSEEDGSNAIRRTAYHRNLKNLKLSGTADFVTRIHVPSLPALVFGHNGWQIFNYREAYELLDRILNEVSEAVEPISAYSRSDAAFQFKLSEGLTFGEFQAKLANLKFPRGRKGASINCD